MSLVGCIVFEVRCSKYLTPMELLVFAFQATEGQKRLNILISADIHYDPLYDPSGSASNCREAQEGSIPAEVGRIGCDGTKKIVDTFFSTVQAMNQEHKFDVIFQLGDIPGHKLNDIMEPIKYVN